MPESAALRLEGRLYALWETGTEGVHWALVTDWDAEDASYENLWTLMEGDELVIFESDGTVLWSGVIEWDWKTRWRNYPLNLEHGQQEVGGLWVHGLQSGVDPEVWADFFMGHELLLPSIRLEMRSGPLRATLTRRSAQT